jgi:hypothetical protein
MEIVSESLVPVLVRTRQADLAFSYSTSEPAVHPTAEPAACQRSLYDYALEYVDERTDLVWRVDEDQGIANGWKITRTPAEAD